MAESLRTPTMPAVPTVLLVSSDPVQRDELVEELRSHLGGGVRVIGAGGVREAADVLTHLTVSGSAVPIAICAHRLPDGSGVELFGHLGVASPATRRVLLTTMDQADAALQAINQAQVDRYLVLPVEPLAERLTPIVDDLLTDWFAQHSSAQVGVTVLGHRYAAHSYLVKDYLARSLVPFTWFDLSDDPEAHALARDLNLPNPAPTTVLFDDGRALYDPSVAELASALGLTQEATRDRYDLVVVGGGPAGLAAAVYGASEGLSVVVVEDDCPGGQAGTTARVDNHLGFPAGLSGADFAHRALAQAKRLGVEWCSAKVATTLLPLKGAHRVVLDSGKTVVGRAVLIATGMTWRTLDVPGVDGLVNAGVYYGASAAEARAAQGEDIVVAGDGDTAAVAALRFAEHARSVTLVVREPSLADAAMNGNHAKSLEGHPRITVHCGAEIGEVRGYGRLEKVVVLDTATGMTEVLPAGGLYVLIGMVPFSEWVRDIVAQDELGFVLTGVEIARRPELQPASWLLDRPPLLAETSIPGVFAAGDVRAGSVKRIASAIGQGAVAVASVNQYLESLATDDGDGDGGAQGRLGDPWDTDFDGDDWHERLNDEG
ncbi:MAG: FAD-dependent oxidoreductase [Actinocrinis sp.]